MNRNTRRFGMLSSCTLGRAAVFLPRIRRFLQTLPFLLLVVLSSGNAFAYPTDLDGEHGPESDARDILDRLMQCGLSHDPEKELDALQAAIRAQHARAIDDLEYAFKRARRSARLPEVVRFQTSARYDRDQQNRKRLTEKYDNAGDILDSALENRDTFQDDMYVNVSLSADWRLSRTRWSKDEVSLRRERTALLNAQKKQHQDVVRHWFALQNARLTWCDQHDAHSTQTQRPSNTRAYRRARLQLWEEISVLNALTHGWYLEALKASVPHADGRLSDDTPRKTMPNSIQISP